MAPETGVGATLGQRSDIRGSSPRLRTIKGIIRTGQGVPLKFPCGRKREHMTIGDIAKVCHEANRALCESLGDSSQVPYEQAEQWKRDSACRGVEFALMNPGLPASAQHEAWLADKAKDGWKYGPVKDADLKEHPCFLPYEELPIEQQAKDHLFKGIVASLKGLL